MKMNQDRDLLSRIDGLPAPRHFFVVPHWIDPIAMDRLIDQGYLTCDHHQRDSKGAILVAMGLQLTTKGKRFIHPEVSWQDLALKGSLAGASFTAMSVVILYLG